MSRWTLFVILLTSAVICKQRRFAWNQDYADILKTENAGTLSKTISESPHKVLQGS